MFIKSSCDMLIYMKKLLLLCWMLHNVATMQSLMIFPQPSFVEPIPNVTVSSGRDVSLKCVVENLGSYRVAWSHKEKNTLISIQERVIMRNSKYTVSHQNYRTWYLHLNKVEQDDSGQYMCQINTTPMVSQTGRINVVVAPNIVDDSTSSDTDIREGSDITLKCTASGSPTPNVKWRREDGDDMLLGNRKVHDKVGKFLNFTNVSRLNMGAYLCIAFNGIPPSISKRIMLNVQFPPMIWIPNQLIGAAAEDEVNIDCYLEAFPEPVTYWTRGPSQVVVVSGNTYDSVVMRNGMYKLHMRLRLRSLSPGDFGTYTCIAKNSLGETEGKIRVYEVAPTASVSENSGSIEILPKNHHGSRKPEHETLSSASANLWNSENIQTIWKKPSDKGSIDAGDTSESPDSAKSTILSFVLCSILYVLRGIME